MGNVCKKRKYFPFVNFCNDFSLNGTHKLPLSCRTSYNTGESCDQILISLFPVQLHGIGYSFSLLDIPDQYSHLVKTETTVL